MVDYPNGHHGQRVMYRAEPVKSTAIDNVTPQRPHITAVIVQIWAECLKLNHVKAPYPVQVIFFHIFVAQIRSRRTVKLPMKFLVNTLIFFCKKLCSPPYCCT